MSDQGLFTPGADPQAVPLPIAGALAYQHGQWWTSTADGFVAGRNVYRYERIWGLNYRDLTGVTDASVVDFQPEGADGRGTLNCNELSIQIGFSDPALPRTGAFARDITMEEIGQYARGFRLRRGRTSTWYDAPITTVQIECDDSSGFFSRNALDADPFLRKGAPVTIDATWRSESFPLFRGQLVSLVENGRPNSDTIILNFQDNTFGLAAPVRGKWSPGDSFDTVDERVQKILDKGPDAYPASDFDASSFTLTNYASQRTLLDEITLSCMSSGCAFFFDNDGQPTLLNERRLSGLPAEDSALGLLTDQCSPNTPNMSYNEIQTAWADHEFGNNIIINNVSQGEVASVEKIATDDESINIYGVQTWSPPQLVICRVEHLQELADWELLRRKDAFYRVTGLRISPINNDRVFFMGLRFKLGMAMFINRTPTASEQTLSSAYVIEGVTINATGTSWTFDIFVSPARNIDSRRFGDYLFGDFEFGGDHDVNP